jgi:IrrE N-terminal-like domain
VVERDLAAAAGGSEALLIPMPGNRFRIAVDPTPRSGWDDYEIPARSDVTRHRMRFRVGHELGHTLFYERVDGEMPSRTHGSSRQEEAFCDRFARGLLLPDNALRRCRRADRLLQIQREYDVSLEVVLRALGEVQEVHAALFYWHPVSRRPVLQWSNLDAGDKLRKWRLAVHNALRPMRGALYVPSAEATLLAHRRQALVIQSL